MTTLLQLTKSLMNFSGVRMRTFILISLVMLVIGCANRKPDHIITTEYEYVTYQLPVKFASGCKVTKPMKVDDYSILTLEERENYLANYSISLLGDLKKCDSKIKGIIKFIDEVNKMAEQEETPKVKSKQERSGDNGN